ncbi:MAG: hypothetical protein GF317_20695 [Candidatus Lokiarchaeota archaeon]|nr:hypothetical protein [Candidatus Lokiarchaeota archaeon]MBD3201884.1 hypothetical protein [Candidatus Lokiarchaeota archaeon]
MKKNENDKSENTDTSEKDEEEKSKIFKKSKKKSQGQVLQEALGLEQGTLETIEKKLFIARFLDYFSEETLDFIYKDKAINNYKEQIAEILDKHATENEEDKLLKQSYENKEIIQIVDQLKTNAENMASEKGIDKPFDKRMRNLSIIVSIPMFALILILTFLPIDTLFLFPLLCVFCMVPTLIRSYIVKKWQAFKEENKMDYYTENREDIMILKGYVGEILENIRARLIELKVPLQLIKFVLHSRDYDNLKLINQKSQKGTTQYYLSFEYPEGMEPFTIPETIAAKFTQPTESSSEQSETPEKNFIVLKEIKGKDGVIESFVPTLKDNKAEEINDLLNECDFTKATEDISIILPNYSPEMAIYCICGEIVEVENVQVCNWKEDFKFYLFEGGMCDCGEKVYALSLMDEEQEVPDKLEGIFK